MEVSEPKSTRVFSLEAGAALISLDDSWKRGSSLKKEDDPSFEYCDDSESGKTWNLVKETGFGVASRALNAGNENELPVDKVANGAGLGSDDLE